MSNKTSLRQFWPHRFGHLFPSFPESKDGGVLESGADLEHSVEIVEAATDVGNRHPLLDDSHATLNRTPRNDFGNNQLGHLEKGEGPKWENTFQSGN